MITRQYDSKTKLYRVVDVRFYNEQYWAAVEYANYPVDVNNTEDPTVEILDKAHQNQIKSLQEKGVENLQT